MLLYDEIYIWFLQNETIFNIDSYKIGYFVFLYTHHILITTSVTR